MIFKYKIANDMEMQDKAITGRSYRHYKAMADSPQTSSFDLTWLLLFIFNSFWYIGSLHLFDRMALIKIVKIIMIVITITIIINSNLLLNSIPSEGTDVPNMEIGRGSDGGHPLNTQSALHTVQCVKQPLNTQ